MVLLYSLYWRQCILVSLMVESPPDLLHNNKILEKIQRFQYIVSFKYIVDNNVLSPEKNFSSRVRNEGRKRDFRKLFINITLWTPSIIFLQHDISRRFLLSRYIKNWKDDSFAYGYIKKMSDLKLQGTPSVCL